MAVHLNSCGTYLAVELLATVAAVPGDSGIQTPEVPHLSISQKKRKKRNEAWYECKRARVRQFFLFDY